MTIQQITPIPLIDPATGRPPKALPPLWNDRYLEMDANFQALQDDINNVANGLGNIDWSDINNKPSFGNAAFKNVGSGSNDVAAGNHSHGSQYIAGSYFISGVVNVSSHNTYNISHPLNSENCLVQCFYRQSSSYRWTLASVPANNENGQGFGASMSIHSSQIRLFTSTYVNPLRSFGVSGSSGSTHTSGQYRIIIIKLG